MSWATLLSVGEQQPHRLSPTNNMLILTIPKVMQTSGHWRQCCHQPSRGRSPHDQQQAASPPPSTTAGAATRLAGCNAICRTFPLTTSKSHSGFPFIIAVNEVFNTSKFFSSQSRRIFQPASNNWWFCWIDTFVPGTFLPTPVPPSWFAFSSLSTIVSIIIAPWLPDTVNTATAICLIGFNSPSTSSPQRTWCCWCSHSNSSTFHFKSLDTNWSTTGEHTSQHSSNGFSTNTRHANSGSHYLILGASSTWIKTNELSSMGTWWLISHQQQHPK